MEVARETIEGIEEVRTRLKAGTAGPLAARTVPASFYQPPMPPVTDAKVVREPQLADTGPCHRDGELQPSGLGSLVTKPAPTPERQGNKASPLPWWQTSLLPRGRKKDVTAAVLLPVQAMRDMAVVP